MNTCYVSPTLFVALEKLKEIILKNENDGVQTVIFCEDRLTLAAERAVCDSVGGSFNISVYTFGRFLSSERGARGDILSKQGSAMVIRKLIENNADKLKLFRRLSATSAAQTLYDTIAVLYSSRVTPDDLDYAQTSDILLRDKLSDISLLYREYMRYLKDNNCMDRNSYLRLLPSVIENSQKIKDSRIIVLAYPAFTCSVSECVKACLDTAESVTGIFVGGNEDVYTNESVTQFLHLAKQVGEVERIGIESNLNRTAECLRKGLFNPEVFGKGEGVTAKNLVLFEGENEEEEYQFIAAQIKKHIIEGGKRYADIAVLTGNIDGAERIAQRVFNQYKIPFYIDIRRKAINHAEAKFIIDYLTCAIDGCTPKSVNAVVSSFLFTSSENEIDPALYRSYRDIFRNYILRLANFRGGVKRQVDRQILIDCKFDENIVLSLRERFLGGLAFLKRKGTGDSLARSVIKLLDYFNVKDTLKKQAEDFADKHPAQANFSSRIYDSILATLTELERLLSGQELTLNEFLKIFKSGLSANEISLIPPKNDAVFIGDISTTMNVRSDVVFVSGLTDNVPLSSSDTALLTDREITALEQLSVVISPKIRQVNERVKQTIALNICSFDSALYLTYPLSANGEECTCSEIIAYAKGMFNNVGGEAITPYKWSKIKDSSKVIAYYSSEYLPLIKRLASNEHRAEDNSAIYEALNRMGYSSIADIILEDDEAISPISFGKALFTQYGSVSPTTLENYFACPYQNFMRQGLRVREREEGAVRPLESGNFIHGVLQELSNCVNDIESVDELNIKVLEIGKIMLSKPPYSSLSGSAQGQYTADCLLSEAQEVCRGMFEQLVNSHFKLVKAESECKIELIDGIKLYGRIDRVDECGDMVRIIDYKTGAIDAQAIKYYMGLKLQLPLYLTAAAKGKRAVGAYYFPAQLEYSDNEKDGVFRLKGFMDGSSDVVENTDVNVVAKAKSAYVDAYYQGRKIDSAMEYEDFEPFISYSTIIARSGTRDLLDGNIAPSPAFSTCDYCKFGGACKFRVGIDGVDRAQKAIKCKNIANIVRKQRGDTDA